MKYVALTLNGQTALIGQQALETRKQLAANGFAVSNGNHAPFHENINDLPAAVEGAGVMGDTRVATPDGPRRIDELAAGDLVIDATGATTKIKHVLKASAPRDAFFLRAPYFGLDQDAVMGPNQHIVVTSDIAEYLFGEETVLVPVWALCDSRKVQHFETRRSDLMYQLQLDSPAPVKLGKCAISALYKHGATEGRVLSTEEARCFQAEYRVGFQN